VAPGRASITTLDALITDGCAFLLTTETELRRCHRFRDSLLAKASAGGDATRELVELGESVDRLVEREARIRRVLRELMSLRARTRLRTFAAERGMAVGSQI
jgi:hypothetical protein